MQRNTSMCPFSFPFRRKPVRVYLYQRIALICCCSSSVDLGYVEANCIISVGVVVVVAIVSHVFAGDVYIIRTIGKL